LEPGVPNARGPQRDTVYLVGNPPAPTARTKVDLVEKEIRQRINELDRPQAIFTGVWENAKSAERTFFDAAAAELREASA
jgi:hypothetical protein